ncbi:GPI anchored endo-1,3(4)-beta-glucanase, putative [Paecilomyces variotii No. 5]|uniref:endo-1,3(4)-beta-glucanase n=1 Tax=Byssochlamys spectabilis (strain No. 5 / NBRC 109023) TaxID=1356009 RepID=V5G5R9_BYSSN|nr:GPI anchored endo-1,3(4)-beta-glucanase, putative [Paecilomyces variotii No. 5]
MLSFPLFPSVGALFLSSLVASTAAHPYAKRTNLEYSLAESFDGSNFFDNFEFSAGEDPTHGFVTYLAQEAAQQQGLVNITSSGSVYMGVDSHTVLNPTSGPGRTSVRVQSKKTYTNGLFVADIQHMPESACGIWPAFWSVGTNWPSGGEIDIIEGVNMATKNEMVLHTQGDCKITNTGMTGVLTADQCSLTEGTSGCTIEGTEDSFGTGFNDVQGGVYAMEWTDEFIKIWFFPRNAIPQSIQNGKPDTSAFGTPMGNFQGSCNMTEEFQAQQFIFDTTFCGDWAGNVFDSAKCVLSNPASALESCVSYVALNPTAYSEAYWEINSIKIYQEDSAAASSSASVSQATTSVPSKATTEVPVHTSSSESHPAAETKSAASSVGVTSQSTSGATSSETPAASSSAENLSASPAISGTPALFNIPAAAASATTSDYPATGESITTDFVTSYTTFCPYETENSASVDAASSSATSPAVTTTTKPAHTSASSTAIAAGNDDTPPNQSGGIPVTPSPVISSSPSSYDSVSSTYPSSSAMITFTPSATTAAPTQSSASPSAAVFTGAANKLTASFCGVAGSFILAMMI